MTIIKRPWTSIQYLRQECAVSPETTHESHRNKLKAGFIKAEPKQFHTFKSILTPSMVHTHGRSHRVACFCCTLSVNMQASGNKTLSSFIAVHSSPCKTLSFIGLFKELWLRRLWEQNLWQPKDQDLPGKKYFGTCGLQVLK